MSALFQISMCAQAEAVAAGVADIPAQLMFVHQGQRDVKEVTQKIALRFIIVLTTTPCLGTLASANPGLSDDHRGGWNKCL